MLQKSPNRMRGRPKSRPDSETRHLLIEAAQREFADNGYAATQMNAVARRAGVSTRTLYRLIPTKKDLLDSVIANRVDGFILAIDADALEGLPLKDGLGRLLTAYGELALSPEPIAVTRLILAECHRFPELAATFYEVAIQRASDAMAAWLHRQSERGLIKLEDEHMAAEMLRGMMIFGPQRAVILGQLPPPSPQEIADRAKICARIFLNGCRSDGHRSP